MGLDCTAYSHMVRTDEKLPLKPGTLLVDYSGQPDDWWDDLAERDGTFVWCERLFTHAIEGLDAGYVYVPTEQTETSELHASYGGYNRFRESLSMAALGAMPMEVWENPDSFRDRPFFELINFSDCEGVLGPVACKNLHADFVEGRAAFVAHPKGGHVGESDFYDDWYDDWTEALFIAAHDGFIVFH